MTDDDATGAEATRLRPPAVPDDPAGPEAGFPPAAPPGPPPRRRRPWLRRTLWSLLAVVVVAVVVASRWNLNEFALQPGSAQSVQQFITVPPAKGHHVIHPVLLTDVQIARVSALSWLFFKTQSDVAFEPLVSVTGGTPASQLTAQGNLEMRQAEASAKTAALRRLGYTVAAKAAGAVVAGTFPGTPAYGALAVGDVITAVEGAAVTSAKGLSAALASYGAGDKVTLTVLRLGASHAVPVPVTLHRTVIDVAGTKVTVELGVEPEDQVDFTYPFPVSINVTNIGGPSAGLAMTLGVIDALTSGSVTGSRTVAATGTIDAAGDVGDVGGVAQKTVAVERAGASIFLVPPTEYRAAMSEDRPGLKVYAVSTLDQALSVLARHGGEVPSGTTGPATGTTTTAAAG